MSEILSMHGRCDQCSTKLLGVCNPENVELIETYNGDTVLMTTQKSYYRCPNCNTLWSASIQYDNKGFLISKKIKWEKET